MESDRIKVEDKKKIKILMARMLGFSQEVFKLRLIEYICRQDVEIKEFTIQNHFSERLGERGVLESISEITSNKIRIETKMIRRQKHKPLGF